jgi:predicted unusual protein kinase regulating ubiquinone biosynthesis (AarF/ABC1/UbiB family)
MLSDKFAHLREHCKTHSLEETRQLFYESFNEDITKEFLFNSVPIASGSIG